MLKFHKLEDYNKERDRDRRSLTESVLLKNKIPYTIPSIGHYKITTKELNTLMFYPKSGILIWKESKKSRQHRFINSDEGVLMRKIKELTKI